MARKPDVQYVRFYTDGSAARQPEPRAPQRKTTLPKPRRQKQQIIRIDPLAVAGILVSAVLLIMMAVGSVQLFNAQEELKAMHRDLSLLESANAQLRENYESGLDMELIERSAISMGMIPVEQAQHFTVTVPTQQQEPELNFWQRLLALFG